MISKKNCLRATCLGLAMLGASLAGAPAAAQTAARTDYRLPGQELETMLRAIARGAGRQILFAPEDVAGRRAAPLAGRHSFEEALAAALAGTGLVAEHAGAVTTIRRATADAPPERADDLAGPRGRRGDEDAAITVTGTRIRGTASASPVIVTTRETLEEAGIADLAGFSRVLQQNYTGGQNPGVAGGGGQGGQNNINNSTTLNLRGLGPDATLTLLNGHRLAYDALNQGVDISAIPLAAIERIEVIADGASALYGSDAVAGVANIILRRDYEGARASARFGAATESGYVQQQYNLVTGARWSSGGFMVAADRAANSEVLARQRAYALNVNGGQTLINEAERFSLVAAGHQRLGARLTLELDAQFADQRSRKTNAFSATIDPLVSGLVNRPIVRSWAVSPRLRLALGADWEAHLSGTRAVSETRIRSRRFANAVETPQLLIYENRLGSSELGAEGPLFALPGGAARLAVGAGYRQARLDVNTSQIAGGARVVTRDDSEARESLFAYGELSLPIVGAANARPMLERLRLSGALRYERYVGIDEVVTPKLGLVYQPHRDISLSASWGRSFKVPTLNQSAQVLVGNLFAASLFNPQPSPPLPAGSTVLFLSGGNPDLVAERASAWSATLEIRPRLIDGLTLRLSHFDVDYRDRIDTPISGVTSALPNPAYRDFITFAPSAALIAEVVAQLPLGLVNQAGQAFDPARVGALVDARLRNSARERIRGLDLAADYRIAAGADRLTLSASASYLRSERQISEGQAVLRRAGLIFNPPNWRARGGGTWERGNAGVTAFVSYVGGTDDNRFPDDLGRIDPFVTLDVSARVRTSARAGPFRDMEFRLSAQNLLNAEPALIREPGANAIPYDSTNQSPLGRMISFTLVKSW